MTRASSKPRRSGELHFGFFVVFGVDHSLPGFDCLLRWLKGRSVALPPGYKHQRINLGHFWQDLGLKGYPDLLNDFETLKMPCHFPGPLVLVGKAPGSFPSQQQASYASRQPRRTVKFSRKHGEGFFRWVHLSCSHESHYKVSLQGFIIMKVIARNHHHESHCKESLQGVIARSHCKESLQGVIARSHCKESLQGVIARSHCKESLQGVMRVIASCKEPSAWSQVQVASARSQVQVASARNQVQLTCEELKSIVRAAG